MEVKARIPGTIVDVKVSVGDKVQVKDVLMIMEAMKMEQPVPSPVSGEVTDIRVGKGDHVRSGEVLAVLK